ncbi:restriction endonuclease [Corynebacterium sp. LK31]|uniref:restriction endonuclease n=1 Tax=Corynebacterium sp. LK31 TaxID=2044576 RepID=UPI001651B758|nr:restriction endonuclease [Corynebacterium sp. LK31]MBC6796943.1 restriction endonuclease [Corynebacterium sp. LK31]
MAPDNIPTTDQFRPVVLRVLSDGRERRLTEIGDDVVRHLGLSDEVLAETIPSGQPRYRNRIAWACSSFAQSGLVIRPKRGRYVISDNGRQVDARNLAEYTEKDMLEWPKWRQYQDEIRERKSSGNAAADLPASSGERGGGTLAEWEEASASPTKSPLEMVEDAQADWNAKVSTDLRQRLQDSTPEFFERAVIELLWAMGYGGVHGQKQHLGRSNDGGVDGVIREDALGLGKVYVQAKRYGDSNSVGNGEIRNFIGALDSRGANKGVFITTSRFTNGAVEAAANYRHGTIVLIDGVKLSALMLDYGVAVQKAHEIILYELDEDFFEEEQ